MELALRATKHCNTSTISDLGLASRQFLAILVHLRLLSCLCNESCTSPGDRHRFASFAARKRTNQLTHTCQLPPVTRPQASTDLAWTDRQTDIHENWKVTIGPAGHAVRTWLVKMVVGVFTDMGATVTQETVVCGTLPIKRVSYYVCNAHQLSAMHINHQHCNLIGLMWIHRTYVKKLLMA